MLISIHFFFLKMAPSVACQWYVIDKTDPGFAICICGTRTSRGGLDKDNYGTSGLLLHIKSHHKLALDKYRNEQEIKKNSPPLP